MFGIPRKNGLDSLAPPIQDWIKSQGWKKLRPIQNRAIEVILGKKLDVIISAPTAGGKTEAAYLPLLSEIITDKDTAELGFDILYVSPLKALINDQQERLQSLCSALNVKITPWHGDVEWKIKKSALTNPSGIIMTTPESLEGFLLRRGSHVPELFGKLKSIIIDELHEFIEDERGMQLQSLLSRIEISVAKKIRRIGLSATLGDIDIARNYLRPNNYSKVKVIEVDANRNEIETELYGYYDHGFEDTVVDKQIACHLFETLRGSNNLVFAGTRNLVEKYSDLLREKSDVESVRNEFEPHHGYLSKDHRRNVERNLKEENLPTTAVCTSTLELGVDIGDISTVVQIGAPYSASALRQRLGRSGRRGSPAKLNQYNVENKISSDTKLPDRLRLGLIRTIAVVDLLLEGWNEPPKSGSLHLSTFVHQVLSVVQEKARINEKDIFNVLCKKGIFNLVSQHLFVKVLNQLAHSTTKLISQDRDGTVFLTDNGRKLVESSNFYAVFETPKVFKVQFRNREIGSLPLNKILIPGTQIILQGRRWEVIKIDVKRPTMWVKQSKEGSVVKFGGDPQDIHDNVVSKMLTVYRSKKIPEYLGTDAQKMLSEGRDEFKNHSCDRRRIFTIDNRGAYLATWSGTVKTWTLGIMFGSLGFKWFTHDGFLEVYEAKESIGGIKDVLRKIRGKNFGSLYRKIDTLEFEKFHCYLNQELLLEDALSSRLDIESLPKLAADILDEKVKT